MDTGHNFFPEILVEVTGVIRKFFIVVITGPYCTGVIWSVAYEPEVIIVFCGTGLSCNSHIVKLACSTCTLFYNVFHCTCQKVSSAFLDDRTFNGSILDQDISVMIKDLCIVDRFDIIAAICDRCIGSTQFYVGYTSGNTAQCSCKTGITPYVTIGIGVCLCSMSKSGETEVVQIFQTKVRSYFFQTLDSNNVDRVLDCCTDRGGSVIGTGCIVYRRTIRVFIRLILKSCCQCHSLFV